MKKARSLLPMRVALELHLPSPARLVQLARRGVKRLRQPRQAHLLRPRRERPPSPQRPRKRSSATGTRSSRAPGSCPAAKKVIDARASPRAKTCTSKEFHPIAPLGTHHTLLSVNEEPTGPDGISACGANDNGHVTLLGSGVGENYSSGPLPEGVAYKIPKGSQVNLNLHLFNLQDDALKGVSGVQIRTTTVRQGQAVCPGDAGRHGAAGDPDWQVDVEGHVHARSDATLFAVSPHMHQLGRHLKAVAKPRGGAEPVTLYDGPYDFNEQRQYPANMLKLSAGDTVDVECTYENTTDHEVKFGESSLDEMCFIGLYRFPLTEDGLICAR